MTDNTQRKEIKTDAEDNKVWGVLAYIFFMIPLIAAPKNSRFSQFHINQGLVLSIAAIAVNAGLWVLTGLVTGVFLVTFPLIIYSVTTVLSAIRSIFMLIIMVLAIYGIINVAKGKMTPLPVIGKFQIIK